MRSREGGAVLHRCERYVPTVLSIVWSIHHPFPGYFKKRCRPLCGHPTVPDFASNVPTTIILWNLVTTLRPTRDSVNKPQVNNP